MQLTLLTLLLLHLFASGSCEPPDPVRNTTETPEISESVQDLRKQLNEMLVQEIHKADLKPKSDTSKCMYIYAVLARCICIYIVYILLLQIFVHIVKPSMIKKIKKRCSQVQFKLLAAKLH